MPNYVTATACAEFLGIDLTNTYLEAELDATILLAESVADSYLHSTYIYREDYEYLLSGNNTNTLTLKLPLKSVTSISVLDYDNTIIETYTASDYRLGPSSPKTGFYRQIFKTQGNFPKGIMNIKLVGTFGFEGEENTDQVFKLAIMYIVKAIFDSKVKDTFTEHVRNAETISIYQKAKDLNLVPQFAQHILNEYKYVTENLRI